MIKACLECTKEFNIKPSHYERRKYCSRICRGKGENSQIKLICNVKECGKEFFIYPSRANERKYCSPLCDFQMRKIKGPWNKKPDEIIICKQCGIQKKIKPVHADKAKFCSHKCYSKSLIGQPGLKSRTSIMIPCTKCKIVIKVKQSQLKKNKESFYCSTKCLPYYKNLNEIEKLEKLKELFEKYVIKLDGCWEWRGFIGHGGYGSLVWNKKGIGAHRASWILHKGSIPKGLHVGHKCNVPTCTNYEHLYLCTPKQNVHDAIKDNLWNPMGDASSASKLKKDQVVQIKKMLQDKINQSEIAKSFNVSRSTITLINNNKTWKHVTID